ncbi:MAG: glycosyltransferase family 4 protein [Vicinamibacterales bacterium]
MTVWLFKDGEPPPVGPEPRRMRMAMLASALAAQGADVHWVSSTFAHVGKRLYSSSDVVLSPDPGYSLHLLHAGQFTRNLSFRRYRFHQRFARRVREYSRRLPAPDVIVCAFPLIDVAAWAVEYGLAHKVPVVVDVRDLWPDTMVDIFPSLLKPLARIALDRDFRNTRYAFTNATALSSMSHGVLRWALAKIPREQASDDRVFPIGFPARTSRPAQSDPGLPEWLSRLASRKLFVYVGMLGVTYNLDVVVEAARLLAAQGALDPHFVIIGTGPRLERINAAAATLPNVTAPGWLEQSAIQTILGRACAGLLPWEGIADAVPNKFFEYIAAGLPVVSSAAGELNELILHEGVGKTFSPTNPESLAHAINQMCDDPEQTAAMSARATALFNLRFREDLVYTQFASYVRDLVAQRHDSLGAPTI